jgi:hypothetical protein
MENENTSKDMLEKILVGLTYGSTIAGTVIGGAVGIATKNPNAVFYGSLAGVLGSSISLMGLATYQATRPDYVQQIKNRRNKW